MTKKYLTPEELQALLDSTRDQKFRKKTDAQLEGYVKNSYSNKEFRKANPFSEEKKKRIGDAMRGKTLEEIIGAERAATGRKARSEFHKGKKRPKEVGEKIASTRRVTGSYDSPTHGMRGKQHQEETKLKQSLKAQVRQELKRRLGLGKNDSIPKDILEEEYKKLDLK